MAALTTALAVLVVIGAGATVLIPGGRRAGQALAVTTVIAGMLALTLGSVPVAVALVLAAVVLIGLLQVFQVQADTPGHQALRRTLIAPAALAAAILVALSWAALQTGWPTGPNPAGQTPRLPPEQLVALGACLLLVITAVLAALTLREPRAAHRVEPSPPRRGASARRTPRGRSRG